jgi:acyl-CoA dehydrogenase
MTMTATRVDGGYVLRGQKSWVSSAGPAEYYVVFATVAPGTRSKGITAFVLEKGDPGFTIGSPIKKMGQRAIVNAELFFEDCFVPEDRRLGAEGDGFRGLMRTFDHSRITLGAAALRAHLLEAAPRNTPPQIWRSHGPAVAVIAVLLGFYVFGIVALGIDASRLLVQRAARMADAGEDVGLEAAMAKLHASETAMWCTWAAVQTLGGWGYSREYPVEKWMRDAKLEEIEEGTSDIQRLIISRRLLATNARLRLAFVEAMFPHVPFFLRRGNLPVPTPPAHGPKVGP